MAVKREMIKDIRRYETKILGPFTKRQFYFTIASLAYSVPLSIKCNVSFDNKILICCILAFPVFVCGFIKLYNTPSEVLILRLIYLKFLTPSKRKYRRSDPFITSCMKKRRKIMQAKDVKYSKQRDFKIYR